MRFIKFTIPVFSVVALLLTSCGESTNPEMEELKTLVDDFNKNIDDYCACLEKEKSKSKCRNFSLSLEVPQELYDKLPEEGHDLVSKAMSEGPKRIRECGKDYDY